MVAAWALRLLHEGELVQSMLAPRESILFRQLLPTNVSWLRKSPTMSYRPLKILEQSMEMASLEGKHHIVEPRVYQYQGRRLQC